MICRLLPFQRADGPTNMAADEVLLEAAVQGLASLRFYGWSEPTLSLGYFQAESIRNLSEPWARLPLVRRPSGGGAIVHDRELTYAIAWPANVSIEPSSHKNRCVAERMHSIIQAAFGAAGIQLDVATANHRFHPLLCFLHHSPGDLLYREAKVVGSAQRRQRGATLQHGSILLNTSPSAEMLPGITNLSGQVLSELDASRAIQAAFTQETGIRLIAGEWQTPELRRLTELTQNKYSQAAWNCKR